LTIAKVILPNVNLNYFDYKSIAGLVAGDYVAVPFRNTVKVGVIRGFSDTSDVPEEKLRSIIEKIDQPSLSTKMLQFMDKFSSYNLTSLGDILKMVIPIDSVFTENSRDTQYTLNVTDTRLTEKQKNVANYLKNNFGTKSEIAEATTISKSVINNMIEKGILIKTKQILDIHNLSKYELPQLLNEQTKAAIFLKAQIDKNSFNVTLIDGVTGSGKTEVYFSAIHEALKQGKQAVILLPEIVLTSQLISRFEKRFGFPPDTWHSGHKKSERQKIWKRISIGESKIVIGARSALLLPYNNLGIIVVDEEHDQSYKQEEGVTYNARDMAVLRAREENIPIILSSATPSLESIANVRAGKYQKIVMTSRYGKAKLPKFQIVDLRENKYGWISQTLLRAIEDNLSHKRQVMLFLNRRGYAPLTLCRTCGYRFMCQACSSWLVEHKKYSRLSCHHCDYSIARPKTCPECSKEDTLVACGPGVERIEEEIQKKFPKAKIALMTKDNLKTLEEINVVVKKIEQHEVDIVIGTQLIAKGHHFPSIALVGVIDADIGLSGGDPRASEKTYQLLEQVGGRAGREHFEGKVIIQTYNPNNNLLGSLYANNKDRFIELELQGRKKYNMPPFSRLACINLSGLAEATVIAAGKRIVKAAPTNKKIQVFGPTASSMSKIRGRFRYKIFFQAEKLFNIQKYITHTLAQLNLPPSVRVKIDIDPYNFF
jgi:primosomal protein N' (replication factor Y) (superfamily II helicase)